MLMAVFSGHEDCSPCAPQCSWEGGFRHEGYIAGSFRTGVPASRDRPTQGRSEGGRTLYDRYGQTRPCQRRGHEYFPWRVRAAANETPEARSVHYAPGVPEWLDCGDSNWSGESDVGQRRMGRGWISWCVSSEPWASSTLWRSARIPLGDLNAGLSRFTRVRRGDGSMAAIWSTICLSPRRGTQHPSQRRTLWAVPSYRRSRVSIGFRARTWLGHSLWKSVWWMKS